MMTLNTLHTLDGAKATAANGPLVKHPTNPRYFADPNGNSIYLTGSHQWANLQNVGFNDPPPEFRATGYTWSSYLDLMQKHNHNLMRLWMWENARWALYTKDDFYYTPLPWRRTGPGSARDGKPKFDLTQFDPTYFERLKKRVQEAGTRGIYVMIMLFQGFSLGHKVVVPRGNNPWHGHPFHRDNNVNGIDGDPRDEDSGRWTHSLDDHPHLQMVRAVQEAYVRHVVDTVNDLGNVLYEISNEDGADPVDAQGNVLYEVSNEDGAVPVGADRFMVDWQLHMVRLIQVYEREHKPYQHPVGVSWLTYMRYIEDLVSLPGPDWVSSTHSGPRGGLWGNNPPPHTYDKPIISDTDHIFGVGGDQDWVWKTFTRGHHPIYMDPLGVQDDGWRSDIPLWERARRAMGDTLAYARRMDLANTAPSVQVSSTGYVLVNPGVEYLIYQPTSDDSFTVDLKVGTYAMEWFDVANSRVAATDTLRASGGKERFTAPFSGDAVLYLSSRS